jgi:hypothetical protein
MTQEKKCILWLTLFFLFGLAGTSILVAQSTGTDQSSQWQQVYVDEHCAVLAPETGEFGSNPDVCRFDGSSMRRSSHMAAKEVDGTVQHSKVDVAEQTYLLQNIHSTPVVFVVAKLVPDGWHIDSDPQPKEMKENVAIFRVTAQPGQIVRLHVGMVHEAPIDDQQ